MSFEVARVYDVAAGADGLRVLVDRLWPRGLSKDDAHVDHWLKQVAPSGDLRKWYGHRPERFDEFSRRYRQELEDDEHAAAVSELTGLGTVQAVTLLTATKELWLSHATVLADVLRS